MKNAPTVTQFKILFCSTLILPAIILFEPSANAAEFRRVEVVCGHDARSPKNIPLEEFGDTIAQGLARRPFKTNCEAPRSISCLISITTNKAGSFSIFIQEFAKEDSVDTEDVDRDSGLGKVLRFFQNTGWSPSAKRLLLTESISAAEDWRTKINFRRKIDTRRVLIELQDQSQFVVDSFIIEINE